jgi:hypothetical protein
MDAKKAGKKLPLAKWSNALEQSRVAKTEDGRAPLRLDTYHGYGTLKQMVRAKLNCRFIKLLLAGTEFLHQSSSVVLDNLMAQRQILLTVSHVLAHDRFEVVNVIEVNVVQALGLGIDVPRHREIEENQWTVPAPGHYLLQVGEMQKSREAPRRSDYDIHLGDGGETLLKPHRPAAELAGKFHGAIE